MIRRVKPFLYSSILGLAAVHCGGSSTPESNTPAQPATTESQPAAPGSTSDTMGSESASGSTNTSGSSAGGEWTSSDRQPASGTDEPGMGDDITTPGAATPLSDAQIAGITDAVHSSEIEQAQLAQSKSKDAHVLSFAQMMINHHGQAKQREQAMGMSSAASPMLQTLSSQARQTTATLRDKTGKDFDRAYLQSQIDQHQKVLDTIDRQLMPNAKNPQLRSHLQSMRPTIEQHLQAAKDAQQALNTSGQKSGSSSGSGMGSSGSGTGSSGTGTGSSGTGTGSSGTGSSGTSGSSSDRPHPTGSPR
jgi:putative membrane protein